MEITRSLVAFFILGFLSLTFANACYGKDTNRRMLKRVWMFFGLGTAFSTVLFAITAEKTHENLLIVMAISCCVMGSIYLIQSNENVCPIQL
jgi:cell division protein FtsW (lipid II flippase)